MALRSISTRISLYGLVGVAAAAVHAGVLLALGVVMPLWLANPLAFLAASLAGYLGHARFTFRPETGGARFARRWLVLQYADNLTICSLLPLVLPALVPFRTRADRHARVHPHSAQCPDLVTERPGSANAAVKAAVGPASMPMTWD